MTNTKYAVILIILSAALILQGCFNNDDNNSLNSSAPEPYVIITYPAQWGLVSDIVEVQVDAGPEGIIDSVNLMVDGVNIASDSSSPFQFSWNTEGLEDSHTLLARAFYGDEFVQSLLITVNIAEPDDIDTEPPYIRLTSPADWAQVAGAITVRAQASDNRGVTNVDFIIDGLTAESDSTAPYEFIWNTSTFPNGNHTLISSARDSAGNYTLSNMVTVIIDN